MEANVATKPQMQIMELIKSTPPVKIAELDFVKNKFIDNYNLCHKDKNGELVYHRQLVHFKQAITSSDQLSKTDPFSLYACWMTISVKNYSVDPEDNEVYLYVLGGKAVLKRQAGAHVRRLMETGQVTGVSQAGLVYKGDDFKVVNGKVINHEENFKSDVLVAGYVIFDLPNGTQKHFVYRKSDWETWREKSPQKAGDNWAGNKVTEDNTTINQPKPGFLRTKIVKHAATDKSWATGSTPPAIDQFSSVEIDEDELPEGDTQAIPGQSAKTIKTENIDDAITDDDSFAKSNAEPAAAVITHDDDDF